MDLVRTVGETERARAGVETGERGVLTDAAPPWIWMAASMTESAAAGAARLYISGDRAARHFDAVKIEEFAAWRVKRRAPSNVTRHLPSR